LAKPWGERLNKSWYVQGYILRLWFENHIGESIYELDFYPLIIEENPGDVFLPLREKDRFRLVKGDYALVWLNPKTGAYDEKAIDIAPECIRFFCEKYREKCTNKSSFANTETITWITP